MKNEIRYSREQLRNEKQDVALKLGLHKRSITPDTLETIAIDQTEGNIYRELCYEEHYKHKDNTVIRFAINHSDIKAENLKQEGIDVWETTKTPVVSIKTTVYKDNKTKEIINNLLHSNIEKNLIQQAVNHLLDNNGVKTVLVDILERSIDQVICTDGIPGIHTVVLYKNPTTTDKHEIVVIDPSNFFFSSHLSNTDIQVNIKHGLLDKISTRHDAIQIYTPPNKDKIGYKPDQWRECIDISVKLAFALNKEVSKFNNLEIKLDAITKYEFVQLISNSDNIDKSIIPNDKPSSSRIKQSSNINDVKKFKACTEAISKNLKIAFSIDKDLPIKIGGDYNNLLAQDINYGTLIGELLGLNKSVKTFIQDKLEQDYTQLIGSIEKYNTDEI